MSAQNRQPCSVFCRLTVTKMGLPRHTEGLEMPERGAHKKRMHAKV